MMFDAITTMAPTRAPQGEGAGELGPDALAGDARRADAAEGACRATRRPSGSADGAGGNATAVLEKLNVEISRS